MKKFFMLLTIALTCLALFSTIAEARRLGGGSSFGKSRSMPTQQYHRAPDAAPTPTQAPASNRSKWLGPLAGLAIGAGLASMLGGGMAGMGGGMSSLLMMLLLAAGVMFLISKFKKSQQQPDLRYGGDSTLNTTDTAQRPNYSGSGYANGISTNIPADFPVDSFLRNSKASFIRLQAANDRKDLNDIREYTTPEVFAEISLQMQERGNAAQQTNVLSINAELLEVANEGDYTIASVRFTGQLSENNNTPENVDEIWHIQKVTKQENATWLLAGIQQTSMQ